MRGSFAVLQVQIVNRVVEALRLFRELSSCFQTVGAPRQVPQVVQQPVEQIVEQVVEVGLLVFVSLHSEHPELVQVKQYASLLCCPRPLLRKPI